MGERREQGNGGEEWREGGKEGKEALKVFALSLEESWGPFLKGTE
jgi:hypothetical protein